MANLTKRVPENVVGEFFVDSQFFEITAGIRGTSKGTP